MEKSKKYNVHAAICPDCNGNGYIKAVIEEGREHIVVQCQNDRSQHKNKAYAMNMLKSRIYEYELQKKKEKENVINDQKQQIGWGSQIRSYVLHPYKLIKDLRTNHESSNVNDVLDGEIDGFLEKSLSL